MGNDALTNGPKRSPPKLKLFISVCPSRVKIDIKPMLSRSMYEAYRWTHDGNTIIPEEVTNDTRSGGFAYDVDANGMRRLDDVVKPS